MEANVIQGATLDVAPNWRSPPVIIEGGRHLGASVVAVAAVATVAAAAAAPTFVCIFPYHLTSGEYIEMMMMNIRGPSVATLAAATTNGNRVSHVLISK